jgi:hypothetical protein
MIKHFRSWLSPCTLFAALASMSCAVPPASTSPESSFRVLTLDQTPSDLTRGYRHTIAKSKFHLGTGPFIVEDDGMIRKTRGEHGIFIEYSNGYSSGIPNARSGILNAAPYSQDSTAHTAHVLGYFKEAGLPQDQILRADIMTMMEEGGRMEEITPEGARVKAEPDYRKFHGFMTVLNRVVMGIPVPDSFAYAVFNADDRVTSETVWWPDLRATLIPEIEAFKRLAADPSYVASLPADVAKLPGALAIHHATPTGEHWYASVTYDVYRPSGLAVRHFDVAGKEVRFGWSRPMSGVK